MNPRIVVRARSGASARRLEWSLGPDPGLVLIDLATAARELVAPAIAFPVLAAAALDEIPHLLLGLTTPAWVPTCAVEVLAGDNGPGLLREPVTCLGSRPRETFTVIAVDPGDLFLALGSDPDELRVRRLDADGLPAGPALQLARADIAELRVLDAPPEEPVRSVHDPAQLEAFLRRLLHLDEADVDSLRDLLERAPVWHAHDRSERAEDRAVVAATSFTAQRVAAQPTASARAAPIPDAGSRSTAASPPSSAARTSGTAAPAPTAATTGLAAPPATSESTTSAVTPLATIAHGSTTDRSPDLEIPARRTTDLGPPLERPTPAHEATRRRDLGIADADPAGVGHDPWAALTRPAPDRTQATSQDARRAAFERPIPSPLRADRPAAPPFVPLSIAAPRGASSTIPNATSTPIISAIETARLARPEPAEIPADEPRPLPGRHHPRPPGRGPGDPMPEREATSTENRGHIAAAAAPSQQPSLLPILRQLLSDPHDDRAALPPSSTHSLAARLMRLAPGRARLAPPPPSSLLAAVEQQVGALEVDLAVTCGRVRVDLPPSSTSAPEHVAAPPRTGALLRRVPRMPRLGGLL